MSVFVKGMDMPRNCADCPCGDAQDGWCYVHNEVLERMGNGYPSTETRPKWCPLKEVKHGKWIKEDEMKNLGGDDRVQTHMYYTVYRCSNCHSIGSTDYKYCPYCGADMRTQK